MCELFGLSSRLTTGVNFSLEAFAAHGAPGAVNVDGWGVAFYDGADVRLYKEPEPAGRSAWLDFVERQDLLTHRLISHIRRATRGGLTHANTQPFMRELGGHTHVFAHNGDVAGFTSPFEEGRPRFRPVGQTDSEAAFCDLLEALAPLWADGLVPSVGARIEVIDAFAQAMRSAGQANFLYSDGDILVAHAHRRRQTDGRIAAPGLWTLHRRCEPSPAELSGAEGIGLGPHAEDQSVTLFASVPLTGEAWKPMVEGELIVARDGAALSDSSGQVQAMNQA